MICIILSGVMVYHRCLVLILGSCNNNNQKQNRDEDEYASDAEKELTPPSRQIETENVEIVNQMTLLVGADGIQNAAICNDYK